MPYAVVAAAAIGAGGAIYSGSQTANASKDAASAQQQALRQALDFQKQVYGTAGTNLQPYIGAGQNALSFGLGALGLPGGNAGGPQAAFGAFQQTPSYQFPLQQGNLALQRQLASMGLQGSGAALKDSIGYNQGYASQNYQNYLSQILGIAGGGQNAATALGGIGNQTGGQVGTTLAGIGNAGAGGIIGANNALTQGFGGATNSLTSPSFTNALSQLYGQMGQSSYPSSSGSPAALQQAWGIGSNQYVP